HEIARRHWIYIDLDVSHPKDVPASDQEQQAAIDQSKAIHAWLLDQGVPQDSMVRGTSGNGAYLLIRIDLPNNLDSLTLVGSVIRAAAQQFPSENVTVDTKVCNASRLIRVPGTANKKGTEQPGRPYREAAILDCPESLVVCSEEILLKFA